MDWTPGRRDCAPEKLGVVCSWIGVQVPLVIQLTDDEKFLWK